MTARAPIGRGRRGAFARAALLLAWAGAACAPASGAAQDLDAARQAWRTGEYEQAVSAYAALAGQPGADAVVHRERARLLTEIGRYEEAERTLGSAATGAAAVQLSRALGEVLVLRGRLDEAEAAFRRAIDGDASDREVARLELARLLWRRGEREAAHPIFDSFIDLYNQGADRLGVEGMVAVGDAVRYLGVTQPALFEDALLAYDQATALDPGNPLPALRLGELFLEKYQSPDAHGAFDAVLFDNPRHPRALLGKARTHAFDGQDAQAMELVRAALETNPSYPEGRTFLARLLLKLEEYDEARAEVQRALEVNPASLEALSMLAAVSYLRGDTPGYEEARDRALALNPRYPDLYNTVAELAVDHRQYHATVELAERAVALDSTSWWGWGLLGMNQLRIGLIDEGRANVERAFAGDPHNVWLFNTLELTDTFERYRTVETEHFQLFLRSDEADLLAPYAAEVAEEAFAAMSERYGAEPPTPIRLEIFPEHGDFSVRTLGLTGLGALGVSFGSVLVMDSPAARPAGEFNWESTLWHELAHAFHLGLSDHRVPRWFSEGLAVHEQRLARPHWGFRADPGFLRAYQTGGLYPVSELNQGFVKPDYPEQVVYSYLQASLVFAMIEAEHGRQAILDMLRGYREGRTHEAIVRDVLGSTPEAFDDRFDRWFRERYATELAAIPALSEPVPANTPLEQLQQMVARRPDDFSVRLALGNALFAAGRMDDAEPHLREALRMFPDYAGQDSPYLVLSRIHRERGELELAARSLRALADRHEAIYDVLLAEAGIRRELADPAGEAEALARALEVFPYNVEAQQRLAELSMELGDGAGAVRARTAVLALDPADRAGAHYELARAYMLAGDRAAARSQVLRALEIAPGFPEAQALLLELRGGGGRR